MNKTAVEVTNELKAYITKKYGAANQIVNDKIKYYDATIKHGYGTGQLDYECAHTDVIEAISYRKAILDVACDLGIAIK